MQSATGQLGAGIDGKRPTACWVQKMVMKDWIAYALKTIDSTD